MIAPTFTQADHEWANCRDGDASHAVLAAQLLSNQPTLCGYTPSRPQRTWMLTTGKHARPTSRRCKRCAALLSALPAGAS